jgi:hypothetical protein
MARYGFVFLWLSFVCTIAIFLVDTVASSLPYHQAAISDRWDACFVRGGNSAFEERYSSIDEYLTKEDREKALSHFHIHGWRWHTASLAREARRLCTLAQRARLAESGHALDTMTLALHRAADYVVGFNMKGLHRIEADLMFPWMREKLTTDRSIPAEASKGFASAMSQLESDREKLVALGKAIVSSHDTCLPQFPNALVFSLLGT